MSKRLLIVIALANTKILVIKNSILNENSIEPNLCVSKASNYLDFIQSLELFSDLNEISKYKLNNMLSTKYCKVDQTVF